MVWTEIVRSQYEIVPAYRGGYCYPSVPIWAPGKTVVVTADVAAMLSPRAFERFLLPCIDQASHAVNYAWMHTHSSYLHILEPLLQLDSLKAIQVTVDYAGPSIAELLAPFRRIQSYKPLIVSGHLSAEDMRCLVRGLAPEGLYVLSLVDSTESGDELLQAIATAYSDQ